MIFSDTRADGGQINQIVNYSHAFVKNAIKRGDIVLVSKVKKKDFGVVDNSKWYNCAHHDAGYPDQECTCDESEEEDILHDRPHKEVGRARAARVVRAEKKVKENK